MTTAIGLFVGLCAVALIAAGFTRNRVPVSASIVIAAVLRIVFALMSSSRKYVPKDVASYFRATAVAVLHGRDPLQVLPGRQWNFLELMPYVHALELRSGLPWLLAVKIAPVVADIVLVWIVARLAGPNGRTRALQYAVNPLSLLVASLHGQVEPVALALALGGVLVLRKDRPALAGLLLGAAVAAKTWPILVLIAVLPIRRPRQAGLILAGSAVVPFACLASGAIFLHLDLPHAIVRLVSYSGYVRDWTWSGAYIALGHNAAGYYSPLAAPGSVLVVAGAAIVLWLLRRHSPEVRVLGVLAAFLVCTAGFGVQYLMWVLPLAIVLSDRWRCQYTITAAGWAALAYLAPFGGFGTLQYLRGLSWLPAGVLVAIIVEQVRRKPGEPRADAGLAARVQIPVGDPVPDRVPVAIASGLDLPDESAPAAC